MPRRIGATASPAALRMSVAAVLTSAVLSATVSAVASSAAAMTTADGAPPGISVSERSARLLRVREGDILELAISPTGPWTPVRVERTYRPVLYPSELALRSVDIRLHLPDLQALQGGADEVDSIVVRLRHPGEAPAIAARLDTAGLGTRAYTSGDLARRNSSTFEVIARFHRAISVVTILASGVFLLTIMTLRGEELRRQVGLMRLVGISRTTIAGAVLLIATGVVLLGTAAGIGLGFTLSDVINTYYRHVFDTDLRFSQITSPLLGEVVLLSAGLGLAAGALTAWRLLRRRPLDQVGR